MTRFVFQGSGHTTGGSGVAAAVVAVIAVAVLAEAVKGAARTLGEFAVIGGALLAGLVLGAVTVLVAVRLRGRRRATAVVYDAKAVQPQLWHPNPRAAPVQPRNTGAIAPAPVVNVNIDAGLLAGLMRAAQQQPAVRVLPASETEELPR